MRKINRIVYALTAAALTFAIAAQATSVARPRDHNPEMACAAVQELIDDLSAGKPFGHNGRSFREFFTDEFGLVEPDERDDFVLSMLSANGKPDRSKMKLDRLYRLHVKDDSGLYLASFSRVSWALKRHEEDGLLMPVEIDDPHWAVTKTYWLIGFRSNDVAYVREAGIAYVLKSEGERVKGC